MPFIPRGAGTSLAGGGAPVDGGVILVLTRMNRILEVNLRDRYAVVEPGVVNGNLNKHLAGTGFHYAPDPSSQGACTIGGNVGTNAGGPHTLKYGVTVNHVLGVEVVTAEGEIVRVGGPAEDLPGLDLVGTLVGSEGTLAIVTKIWVRLTRNPQGVRTMLAVFESIDDATQAISDIIGAGIIPAALEMMDQGIIAAVEAAFHFGFPLDAEAVLIDRSRRAWRRGSMRSATGWRRFASSTRLGRFVLPRMRRSGCSCGNVASRRSARLADSARAFARRMASCRGRSCRIFSPAFARSARSMTCES